MAPYWSPASAIEPVVHNLETMRPSHQTLALFPRVTFPFFTRDISFRAGSRAPLVTTVKILRRQTDGSATNLENSVSHPNHLPGQAAPPATGRKTNQSFPPETRSWRQLQGGLPTTPRRHAHATKHQVMRMQGPHLDPNEIASTHGYLLKKPQAGKLSSYGTSGWGFAPPR